MLSDRPILLSRPLRHGNRPQLGAAHYSYGFAARNFERMFCARGVDVLDIAAPEQFKSERWAALHGIAPGEHLHLIFRSTEDIRPIPGAYNVACFAWEFDRLKQDGLPEEPIQRDQARMLAACQEVWVPCSYTREVLVAHGIKNAHVVPAPVATPSTAPREGLAALAHLISVPLVSTSLVDEALFERLARAHSAPLGDREQLARATAAGKLFLTICNPYDKRKNLAALIEGFLLATSGDPDATLLVKLVTSGAFEEPRGYLYHQIRVLFGNPHCINEPSVLLFSGHLPDELLTELYGGSTFYVAAAIGEGQNLPLLESMAHGCIPIAPRHTAMADYISAENAVVMSARRYRGIISGLASDVAASRIAVDVSDRYQVADAVRTALSLSPEQREAKRDAARATVAGRYGDDAVFARVSARLKEIDNASVAREGRPRRRLWRS